MNGGTTPPGHHRDTPRNAGTSAHPGRSLLRLPTGDNPIGTVTTPPTPPPAVGGARLTATTGRVNNKTLEARRDVLTYTTPALGHDIEVIGEISAEIWFRSSLSHADIFVRLCDVDPRGRSFNICDGLISLTDADRLACRSITLWPTAHRFKKGHRIRVQVCSGAFPRFARNTGTGESHATAVELRVAEQEIYHDPDHPSAIVLLPQRTV
ncbi:CocE/NonD family hydrolase [Nocardia sp. NPDC005745]|uniref:CocE/NonD family hydrolase n=1 Tax=Nocardia sp. NPDC005745 TaxID=3157061 RepID=UPI0033C73C54